MIKRYRCTNHDHQSSTLSLVRPGRIAVSPIRQREKEKKVIHHKECRRPTKIEIETRLETEAETPTEDGDRNNESQDARVNLNNTSVSSACPKLSHRFLASQKPTCSTGKTAWSSSIAKKGGWKGRRYHVTCVGLQSAIFRREIRLLLL